MTEINELCRDIQMKLPDEIWMLDSLERYRRGAVHTDDFARMDGRTYLSAWLRFRSPTKTMRASHGAAGLRSTVLCTTHISRLSRVLPLTA